MTTLTLKRARANRVIGPLYLVPAVPSLAADWLIGLPPPALIRPLPPHHLGSPSCPGNREATRSLLEKRGAILSLWVAINPRGRDRGGDRGSPDPRDRPHGPPAGEYNHSAERGRERLSERGGEREVGREIEGGERGGEREG